MAAMRMALSPGIRDPPDPECIGPSLGRRLHWPVSRRSPGAGRARSSPQLDKQQHRSDRRPMQEDHVIQFRDDSFGPEFFNVPDLAAVRDLLNKARRGIEFLAYDPTARPPDRRHRWSPRDRAGDRVAANSPEVGRGHADEHLVQRGILPRARRQRRQSYQSGLFLYAEELERGSDARGRRQARSHATSVIQPLLPTDHGRRFSDYLCEMRVGEACDLLQNTDLPITDVCFSVGFNNISWFNRCFMEIKKVTPREYRRIGLGRYGPFGIFPHAN